MSDDLLKKIADSIGRLSLSETKVASCIVADPQIVVGRGMAAIAAEADVSEPTVMRFCRSMGFSGFRDFKESFSSFLGDGGIQTFAALNPVDSINSIILKKHLLVRQQLKSFVEEVENEELRNICNTLASSSTIAIFSGQTLMPTAYNAHNCLLSCGMHSVVYSNSDNFTEVVKTLPSLSSLLFLSRTGRDDQMIASIKVATEKNLTPISLTKRYSSLAAESKHVIYFAETQVDETEDLNFTGLLFVNSIHSILQNMR